MVEPRAAAEARPGSSRPPGEASSEHHAWAGAAAGFFAGILLYPAETVSMRYKMGGTHVFRTLRRHEPYRALWSGCGAGVIGGVPSTAVYFAAYENFKHHGERSTRSTYHPLIHALSGATAELISSIIYVPFEVVKARMMLGNNPGRATNGHVPVSTNYANSLVALWTIARTEGRRGLYAGYLPCIATDTSFRALQFSLYEASKKHFLTKEDLEKEISQSGEEEEDLFDPIHASMRQLLVGSLVGGAAAVLTNPLDVITVRSMAKGMTAQKMELGWNLRGLFSGASYRAMSLAPHSAVTFFVYEGALKLLQAGEEVNRKRHA